MPSMKTKIEKKAKKFSVTSKQIAEHPYRSYLLQTSKEWNPTAKLKLNNVQNPLPNGTLGYAGLATHVEGPSEFQPSLLIQRLDSDGLLGINPTSVRVFRFDNNSFLPVWDSGIVVDTGVVWSKIRRPGIYAPIGLPRDKVVLEMLRNMAVERRYIGTYSKEELEVLTKKSTSLFIDIPEKDLDELRRLLTISEVRSAIGVISPKEIKFGRHGGHIQSFRLPQDMSISEFKKHLVKLRTPRAGLPEEALFFKPELLDASEPPWHPRPGFWPLPWFDVDTDLFQLHHVHHIPCWRWSKNWRMYHHDKKHSGIASGCSHITSKTVGSLNLRSTVGLVGPVNSIPSIVNGKIFVGTAFSNDHMGGTLYKIDLHSGLVERTFQTDGNRPAYFPGIGSSPAIVEGKVYFTAIPGRVYCVDANTFSLIWVTDLRDADLAHNQPVQNDNADCWSSPLVVNGKVYVGCGEGENNAFGFVYCLNAENGHVIWLFCTNKFSPASENEENTIPASAVTGPLPPRFTTRPDPSVKGVSIWSSCAYDHSLNEIFVGTGNSSSGDFNPLPDAYYGSGVLALDANSGEFRGFFEPSPTDSYRIDPEGDTDVDVPSSPLLFNHRGKTILGIGSKNGSFFLLDAKTMTAVGRRQLLPKDEQTNTALPNVDPHAGFRGENYFGIFGTAAVQYELGVLFVGIGGYSSAIDSPSTPFMRALDWDTLNDFWFTSTDNVGGAHVKRYTVPRPPMYTTPGEAGLSSPAVVNDVVFISTSKPALYALDVATGLHLWTAPGLGAPTPDTYMLGPAIYGNYVVVGSQNGNIYIYSL
jgi:outer membrane protein assembly factor BamB